MEHQATQEILQRAIRSRHTRNMYENNIIEQKRITPTLCFCPLCQNLLQQYFNSIYNDTVFSASLVTILSSL